jgi:hypothetical protein
MAAIRNIFFSELAKQGSADSATKEKKSDEGLRKTSAKERSDKVKEQLKPAEDSAQKQK